MPSLNNHIKNIFKAIVGSHFTGSNADAEMRGIKPGLNGLIKLLDSSKHREITELNIVITDSESRWSLDISILRVQRRIILDGFNSQRTVLGSNVREVANGVHLRS